MKYSIRRIAVSFLNVVLASAPVVAQERILVPQPDTAAVKKQDQRPGVARPELVLQSGVTIPATIVAFSPDGRLIASMSFQGGAIKLWDAASGRELCNLNLGSRDAITSAMNSAFTFNGDSRSLVSHSSGTLKQWDVTTGKEISSTPVGTGQESGSASFSADARTLVTLAQSRRWLGVFDVATGKQIQKLDLELNGGEQVNTAALSLDGKILATSEESHESNGSDITSLVLREVASWRVLRTIRLTEEKSPGRAAFSSPIRSQQPSRVIRFLPDGRNVAVAIRDITYEQSAGSIETKAVSQRNVIKVFDISSGRETQSVAVQGPGKPVEPELTEFIVPNSFASARSGSLVAAAANDQTVRLLDTATGQTKATISGHKSDICSVSLNADGTRALTAGLDSSIRVWDVSSTSPALVRTLDSGAIPVTALAFAEDGRSLIVGGLDSVNRWELATGASLRTVDLPQTSSSTQDRIRQREGTYVSDGGQMIVSQAAADVKVWDARSGREVRSFKRAAGKPVSGGAVSADGKFLAFADEVPQSALGSSSGNSATPASPGASVPAGTTLPIPGPSTSTSSDPSQSKSDKEERKRAEKAAKQQQEAMKQMEKMSKSGRMPAGMPDMSQMQKIMEAAQSGDFGKLQEAASQMTSMIPGMAGATAKAPIGVRLVNLEDGSDVGAFGGARSLTPVERASIAISRDGRIVASSVGGYRIRINETATGREVASITANRAMNIERLVLSPDAKLLAAAVMETKPGVNLTQVGSDFSMNSMFDFALRLWDISDPARPKELRTLTGHTGMVSALAFSRNGKTIASGGYDATVRLWEVDSGKPTGVLNGHSLAVTALQFNEDGTKVVSGSDDGSSKLWQTDSGELLCTLVTLNRGADWLVVTPDGLFDGTPDAWKQILWRFTPNIFDVTPVEVFFNEFYYPGLLSAIASGARPHAAADVSQKDRRQPVVALTRADGQSGGTTVTSRTMKVKVDVSGAGAAGQPAIGATDVRLFRNGTLVKLWRGDVLKGQAQVSLEAEIPVVAGENRLTAYAFNRDNVKSLDASLTVMGASELKRKGTAYILALGVNRYANSQYNLKYAVPDARSFAEEVSAQQTKIGQYEKVEVITLTDQDVTKDNILLALKGLSAATAITLPPALARIRQAQPEDAVMIYFAGHGTARGSRFYLVPHDLGYEGPRTAITPQSIDTILKHSVSDLELEAAIEGLDAEKLLLVIDACNSGQALEAEEKRRGPMNSKGLAQLAYEKGIYILTAAQSYQAALEAAQLGHGYLTYALVEEGLKQGLADRDAKDGQILGREWFNYATDRVPQMQEKGMQASRLLLFVEGEESVKDPARRSIQRPRVFYRREVETRPMVIAKP